MSQDMCPRCGALRNMRVTTSRRKVVDADGESRTVITKTYHCEVCSTFVRSEEVEQPETEPPEDGQA